MNQIRAIQELNKKEIENGISPEGSWHVDYRDTAYIYFGGLPYELSEGDVITIFSQFGEPVFLKLVRDKETGKSKGFGWLKYEDQRSADLAVDNIGGADISGRLIRVDHARYKARDDEDQEEFKVGWEDIKKMEGHAPSEDQSSEDESRRPMLPEEIELAKLIQNHDDDDPSKAFLIDQKKEEVEEARRRAAKSEKKHKHRHHHHHRRSRRDGDEEDRPRRSHREGSEDRERRPRDDDSRRHRHRDDSRDRERRDRRDGHRDAGEERSRHRDKDGDRQHRHDRKGSKESRHRSQRDDDDHKRRHREDDDYKRPRRSSRSRSP